MLPNNRYQPVALDPRFQSKIRPIAKPGTPAWVRKAKSGHDEINRVTLGVSLKFFGLITLVLVACGSGNVVLVAAAVAALGTLGVRVGRALAKAEVVAAPSWSYRGTQIVGEGFDRLESVDGRFAYAEKLIGEVPTGISWDDVRPDVETVLWSAAGHAAQVSWLDHHIDGLKYAATGTPQAVEKANLEKRRAKHLAFLEAYEQEADELVRVAGNAVAAAKIAMGIGGVAALDVVVPTREEIRAMTGLAQTRLRLEALTQAWTELDESTQLRRAALDAEATETLPPASGAADPR